MLSRVHSISDLSLSVNKESLLASDTDSITVDGELTQNLISRGNQGYSQQEIEEAFKDIKFTLKNVNIKIPKG